MVLERLLQSLLASPSVTSSTTATATRLINHLHPRSGGHPYRYPSSPDDEVSVWGAGFSPESRELTRVPQACSTAPQGLGLGSEVRTP